MNILSIDYLGLWIACLLLVVSSIFNVLDPLKRVPNWMTMPCIAAGWTVAVLASFGVFPSAGGGILASLAATAISLVGLVPLFGGGWLGGGSVKMQMAFGAWAGCAVPVAKASLMAGLAVVICSILMVVIYQVHEFLLLRYPARERKKRRRSLVRVQPVFAVGSIASVAIFAF